MPKIQEPLQVYQDPLQNCRREVTRKDAPLLPKQMAGKKFMDLGDPLSSNIINDQGVNNFRVIVP